MPQTTPAEGDGSAADFVSSGRPQEKSRVIHQRDDILHARVLAICCGYKDADDLNALRDEPGFRLARPPRPK